MNLKTENGFIMKSRNRAPNFTREEQEMFTKIIENYIPIIEPKKTDFIKQSDKQKAWACITEIYNANTTMCSRTTNNLISCYRNMKSRLKKQRSDAKMLLKGKTVKSPTLLKKPSDTFAELTEHKLKLIKLNLEVVAEELKERKLNVELKELEINHKKKLQELELQNQCEEELFKQEMRQKELLFINLKIKHFEKGER